MARPKYQSEDSTAKSKMKAAFWELLSEMNYSHITVKKLTSRAQLNPNTFYYHYDTMSALALDAFNDEKLYEIPTIIHARLVQDEPFSFSDALGYVLIEERWKKLRLFVASDSTVLQQYIYDAMESFWLSLIGVEKNDLSKLDYLDLTFILNGAMSIIKMQDEHFDIDFIKHLPERALGKGIMQTLERLLINYQETGQ